MITISMALKGQLSAPTTLPTPAKHYSPTVSTTPGPPTHSRDMVISFSTEGSPVSGSRLS